MVIFRIFYSIYLWLIILSISSLYCTIAILRGWNSSEFREPGYKLAQQLVHVAMRLAFVSVEREDFDRIPKGKPLVFIANHLSMLDIIVLTAYLPVPVSFFSKQELIKVPLLGRIMVVIDMFLIDRSNPRKAIKQMDDCKEKVRSGRSVVFFPEGTRSREGHILPFKKGAFVFASDTDCDVVPLYIEGTDTIIPPGKFLLSPGRVRIRCFDPLSFNHSITPVKAQINDLRDRSYDLLKSMDDDVRG